MKSVVVMNADIKRYFESSSPPHLHLLTAIHPHQDYVISRICNAYVVAYCTYMIRHANSNFKFPIEHKEHM